ENITLKEAFPLIIEKGYSRIPLYRNSPENIQGIVLVRDLSKAILEKRENEELLKFALDPIFVPETLSVNELFFQFKQKKLQIAIVLDEYGGLSGVATMEDVAEQLLGELYDEHESGLSERITCLNLKTNTYLILCDTSFQQFLDEFGIKDEIEENINTVASYILENAGHIPKLDEKVETEYGTFLITKRKGNRLESCKFYPASVD
ncbi:MAG: CBS domain-containing protein, partial [Sphaerochaetaceae bacterium]